jgi:hypothetical protein
MCRTLLLLRRLLLPLRLRLRLRPHEYELLLLLLLFVLLCLLLQMPLKVRALVFRCHFSSVLLLLGNKLRILLHIFMISALG